MSAEITGQLVGLMNAPVLSQAVCTFADLGIPDMFTIEEADTGKSVSDLARQAECDERTLYRVLRFMAGHGIFEEVGPGVFRMTPLARALRSDAEGTFRPAAQMFRRLYRSLGEFEHTLRTGGSALEKALGEPLFEHMKSRPDEARIFDAAMTSFHGTETGAMLDVYDFGDIRTLADVGGGNGSLLVETLRRVPHIRGILYDLGHVAANARASIEAAGLAERCTVIEGSFFDTIPTGADTYIMRHIIHDWSDEDSLRILRNCRQAMPENGRLLVVEPVIPPGNDPSPAKDMDVAMLLYPGGMERTEEEYRQLFSDAGFELSSVTPTASPVSIVEGRPV